MLTKSFITGSYAYGTPRPDSDIDLVVLLPPDVLLDNLDALADKTNKDSCAHRGHPSMMFGKLNLIVFHDEREFKGWRKATEELKARRPVTKAEAIKHIDKCCKQFGFIRND